MKAVKELIAILIYMIIAAVFLGFRLSELFDGKQFLLVLLGSVILYLPNIEREDIKRRKKPDMDVLARNAVYASYIETFILLFALLYHGQDWGWIPERDPEVFQKDFMRNIALNLRPLLYGICLYIAFASRRRTKKDERDTRAEKVWTAEECYYGFLELGLTRREAEVAVQIGKGMSNKEIAMELNISETTVKKHVSNILEKLHAEKREQIRERLMS